MVTLKPEKLDYLLVPLLLGLSLFSIRTLLFSDLLVYWDWFGIGPYYSIYLYRGLHAWSFNYMGFPSAVIETNILPYLFSFLVGNKIASNFWLLFTIPLSGISMYMLARKLVEPGPSFISAIIYLFNPFILDNFLQGHIGLLIGYAIFPLFFLLALKSLDDKNTIQRTIFYTLISGLILALIIGAVAHFMFLVLLVLVANICFRFLIYKSIHQVIKNILIVLAIVFVSIGLLLPWAVHVLLFSLYTDTFNLIDINFLDILSGHSHILNVLRLVEHPGPGFNSQLGYYSISYWTLLGLLAPFLVFSSIMICKKEKKNTVVFFLMLTVIGLLLSTGTTYLKNFYTFLYFNVPFFYSFRESSKFLVLVVFSYSVLAGISVSSLFAKWDRIKEEFKIKRINKKVYSLLIFFLIISGHLISSWPLLTGDNMLYKIHPKYEISEEYKELGEWINSQEDFFRVIILPYDNYVFHTWHLVSYKPVLSIDYFSLGYMQNNAFGGMEPASYQYATFLFKNILDNETYMLGGLLSASNVKYIILRDEIFKEKNSEAFTNFRYKVDPQRLKYKLDNSDLRVIKKFNGFTVYENPYFKKHIIVSDSPIIAIGDRELIKLLQYLPGFKATLNPLIYTSQQPNPIEVFNISNTLVLNTNSNDLIFQLIDKKYVINAYDIAEPSRDIPSTQRSANNSWIRSDTYEYVTDEVFGNGSITYGNGYATTTGKVNLSVQIPIEESTQYEVWLRILYSTDTQNISIHSDNKKIGTINTRASTFLGFKWTKMGEVSLEQGSHEIKVHSEGKNAVDRVVIVPRSNLEKLTEKAAMLLKDKNILYVSDARKLLKTNLTKNMNGIYKAVINGTTSTIVEVPVEGNYTLFVKGKLESIKFTIGGVTPQPLVLNNESAFYKTTPVYLERGTYDLKIDGNGTIDLIGIFRGKRNISEFFSNTEPFYRVENERPTDYSIFYNASKPVMITLYESYNPFWRAYINSSEIRPVVVNSYANGFFIENNSSQKITINFIIQDIIDKALLISALFLGSIFLLLVFLRRSAS